MTPTLETMAEEYATTAWNVPNHQEVAQKAYLAGYAAANAKIEALTKALGFYADTSVWDCDRVAYRDEIIDADDLEPNPDGIGSVGGKLARETLAHLTRQAATTQEKETP